MMRASNFLGANITNQYVTSLTCVEPVSAGQFTIPASVLESLPASGSSADGLSLGGSLGIESGLPQEFTAPNLDLGLIFFGTLSDLEVPHI
jgi:hypothetical protein